MHKIEVPYIDQSVKYPTGCESVSAVMLLKYLGYEMTVDEFIKNCLECREMEMRDGKLYGPDPEMPVVFWACINMRKEITGPEWKLLDSGETFCWTSNEHCMLLVGYDEEKYYFNDPYNNNGVIGYERELVEKRHAAQHSMAIGTVRI